MGFMPRKTTVGLFSDFSGKQLNPLETEETLKLRGVEIQFKTAHDKTDPDAKEIKVLDARGFIICSYKTTGDSIMFGLDEFTSLVSKHYLEMINKQKEHDEGKNDLYDPTPFFGQGKGEC